MLLAFVALFFLHVPDKGRKGIVALSKAPPGEPGSLRAVALEGGKALAVIDPVLGEQAIQYEKPPD